MSKLAFASTRIGTRQALATGRFFERFTERGFAGFGARLGFTHAGGSDDFRAQLVTSPEGWFALHLDSGREMPNLADADPVTLRLTLTRPGAATIERTLDVAGADLAVVEAPRTIDGQALTVLRVARAPFTFEIALDPLPVLLDGLVLHDSDAADPAAGIVVRIEGLPDLATDDEGRFRVPALPVAETVTLRFDEGGTVTERVLRPAWGAGAMTATFSIPPLEQEP